MLVRGGPSITAFLAKAEESLSLLRTPWECAGEEARLQAATHAAGERSPRSCSPRLTDSPAAPSRRPPRALPAADGAGGLHCALRSLEEREKDVQEQLSVQAKTLLGVDRRLHELEGRLRAEASCKEDPCCPPAKCSPGRPKGVQVEDVACSSEGCAGGSFCSSGSSNCSTSSGSPPATAEGLEVFCEHRLVSLETRVRKQFDELSHSLEAEAQKRVERALEAHVSELLDPHGRWAEALETRVSGLLGTERPLLQALEARIAGRMDLLEDRVAGLLEAACPQSEHSVYSERSDMANSRTGEPQVSSLEGYVTGLLEASKTRVLGQLKELEVRGNHAQRGRDPCTAATEEDSQLASPSAARRRADRWFNSEPPWEGRHVRMDSSDGTREAASSSRCFSHNPSEEEEIAEASDGAICTSPAEDLAWEAQMAEGQATVTQVSEDRQRDAHISADLQDPALPDSTQPPVRAPCEAELPQDASQSEAEPTECETLGEQPGEAAELLEAQTPLGEVVGAEKEQPPQDSEIDTLGIEQVDFGLSEAEASTMHALPTPQSSSGPLSEPAQETCPSSPHSCPSPLSPVGSVDEAAPPSPPAPPAEEAAARPRRPTACMQVVVQDPAAVKNSPVKCSSSTSSLPSPASTGHGVPAQVGAAPTAPAVAWALAAVAAAAVAGVQEQPAPGSAADLTLEGRPLEEPHARAPATCPPEPGPAAEGARAQEEPPAQPPPVAAPGGAGPAGEAEGEVTVLTHTTMSDAKEAQGGGGDDEDAESDETISVSDHGGRPRGDSGALGGSEGEGGEELEACQSETCQGSEEFLSPRYSSMSEAQSAQSEFWQDPTAFAFTTGMQWQPAVGLLREELPKELESAAASPIQQQREVTLQVEGSRPFAGEPPAPAGGASPGARRSLGSSSGGSSSGASEDEAGAPPAAETPPTPSSCPATPPAAPPQVPALPPLPAPAPGPSGPQTPAFGAAGGASLEVWDEFLAGLADRSLPTTYALDSRPPLAPRGSPPRPWPSIGPAGSGPRAPEASAPEASGALPGGDWLAEWERQGKRRTVKDIVSALTARSSFSPRKMYDRCDDMDRPWTARGPGPRIESPRSCSMPSRLGNRPRSWLASSCMTPSSNCSEGPGDVGESTCDGATTTSDPAVASAAAASVDTSGFSSPCSVPRAIASPVHTPGSSSCGPSPARLLASRRQAVAPAGCGRPAEEASPLATEISTEQIAPSPAHSPAACFRTRRA